VILGPERVVFPDDVAVEILKRCDGEANVETIAVDLAQGFEVTVETVREDVLEFLRDMAEKGFIEG
jgi:pyrroloquinoline quinone biosynthesis protein D